MTRQELIARLKRAGIEEAASDADLLLTQFAGVSPAGLLAERDADYTGEELESAVRRREAREPLSYIIGERAFYGEVYRVTPDCLIPRSDSELLVEEAISRLPKGAHFADLCTGSGCLAISVLAHRPDCTADAFDISSPALALAKENAQRNGVFPRLTLTAADLLTAALPCRYDAILSNPPYIAGAVLPSLSPEVRREPLWALDGGEDGLCFYRSFLSRFSSNLKSGGRFYFEIGYDQGEALRRMAAEAGFSAEILRDFGGNERLAILSPR